MRQTKKISKRFYNDAMRRFIVTTYHTLIFNYLVVLGGSLAMNHHDAQRSGSKA